MLNKLVGISWFLTAIVLSNIGDIIIKFVGSDISPYQTTFFRFGFSFLTLIPFIIVNRDAYSIKTPYLKIHLSRALILVLATISWVLGINSVALSMVTSIGFTIPIFVLIICFFFLKEESISLEKIFVTLGGFLSIFIILSPHILTFKYQCLLLVLSAFLYASLDVINKNYSSKESTFNMLFYSSFLGTLLSFLPAFYYWQPIDSKLIHLLLILGVSANLILFCIIKAYKQLEVSFLAPFHYFEFVQSSIVGFFIFRESLHLTTLVGVFLIIAFNTYLVYHNRRNEKSS